MEALTEAGRAQAVRIADRSPLWLYNKSCLQGNLSHDDTMIPAYPTTALRSPLVSADVAYLMSSAALGAKVFCGRQHGDGGAVAAHRDILAAHYIVKARRVEGQDLVDRLAVLLPG